MMQGLRLRAAAALGLGLGVSCGSGDSPRAALEAREPDGALAVPAEASAPAPAVEPAHARLAAFLPEGLSGRASAVLESEGRAGRAVARGCYQVSPSDPSSAVELEIFSGEGPELRAIEELFAVRVGERVEIEGFDALVDERGRDDETRFEVWLRLSETLWVRGSGPGPWESVRASVEAIDLRALAEAVADGSLSGAGARAGKQDQRGAVVALLHAPRLDHNHRSGVKR